MALELPKGPTMGEFGGGREAAGRGQGSRPNQVHPSVELEEAGKGVDGVLALLLSLACL